MSDCPIIRTESPDQPDVRSLLDGLDAYLASLYPPDANYILDVHELLAPEVSFYVARDGGQAVATAALVWRPGEPSTQGLAYGEIKRMVVDPAFRGRGLGNELLGLVESRAREQGVRMALLETGRLQTQAVRLYERCGYAPRAAFGGYLDNGLSVFYGKAL